MFEDRLALLEGCAEACSAQASGMAAVHLALMGLVRAGDHILAGQALFGSNRWILNNWAPRFGVETTMVPGPDIAAWRAAVRPNTKVFLLESPANPLLEITSISPRCPRSRREIGACCGRRQRNGLGRSAGPLQLAAPRRGGLFGHQAYRRAGPAPGRRRPWRHDLLEEPIATRSAG